MANELPKDQDSNSPAQMAVRAVDNGHPESVFPGIANPQPSDWTVGLPTLCLHQNPVIDIHSSGKASHWSCESCGATAPLKHSVRACENCGTAFKPEPENVGKQRFCCSTCKSQFHARKNEPDQAGLYVGRVLTAKATKTKIKALLGRTSGVRYVLTCEITEQDFDRLRPIDGIPHGEFSLSLECRSVKQKKVKHG